MGLKHEKYFPNLSSEVYLPRVATQRSPEFNARRLISIQLAESDDFAKA